MSFNQIIGLSQPTASNSGLRSMTGQLSMSRSLTPGTTGSNNVKFGVNGTFSKFTVHAGGSGTSYLGSNGTNLNSTVIATGAGVYTDTTNTDVLSSSGTYYFNLGNACSAAIGNLQTTTPITIFGGGESGAVSTSGTGYMCLSGPTNSSPQVIGTAQISMPIAGVFSNLRGYCAGTGTFSLNVNGTVQTLSISGTASTYVEDTTHSVAVSSGDLVSLELVNGTMPNPYAINFVPNPPNGDNILRSYFPGGHTGALLIGEMNGTSNNFTMPVAGTAYNLAMNAASSGTSQLYKNGTAVNGKVIATGAGNYIDVTNTDTFGTSDQLDIRGANMQSAGVSIKQAYIISIPQSTNFQIIG